MEHNVKGLVEKVCKTGKVMVDWSKVNEFTVDEYLVKVMTNEMVVKVAKTSGKERKERRLDVTIDGINFVNVGTQSVKKGSFINRLLKITNQATAEVPTVEVHETPEIDAFNWDLDRFTLINEPVVEEVKPTMEQPTIECESMEELTIEEVEIKTVEEVEEQLPTFEPKEKGKTYTQLAELAEFAKYGISIEDLASVNNVPKEWLDLI